MTCLFALWKALHTLRIFNFSLFSFSQLQNNEWKRLFRNIAVAWNSSDCADMVNMHELKTIWQTNQIRRKFTTNINLQDLKFALAQTQTIRTAGNTHFFTIRNDFCKFNETTMQMFWFNLCLFFFCYFYATQRKTTEINGFYLDVNERESENIIRMWWTRTYLWWAMLHVFIVWWTCSYAQTPQHTYARPSRHNTTKQQTHRLVA